MEPKRLAELRERIKPRTVGTHTHYPALSHSEATELLDALGSSQREARDCRQDRAALRGEVRRLGGKVI